MNCRIYADGRRIKSDAVIGTGLDAYIVKIEGSRVLKVPKLLGIFNPDGSMRLHEDNEYHMCDLDIEKEIYARLHDVPGVATCLETSMIGLTLEYYQNGSLEDYIERKDPPGWPRKMDWILQVVDVIAACHERKVLVFDIALRNFLLADDWSIRAIDFANSCLLPDSGTAVLSDPDGYTVEMDILHVANIIYSISRWKKFEFDCITKDEWPVAEHIPLIGVSPLDLIIAKMWNFHYNNLLDVRNDISSIAPSSQQDL